MTIRKAAEALDAEILHNDFTDVILSIAYTSDLLSDVLANAKVPRDDEKSGGVLITIQAHKNTVAVATVVNIRAIIICNSRPVPEDMLDSARKHGIALLRTKENQFTVSGKIFSLLV